MIKILLIEDDKNLGFVIQDQLQSAGFEVEWIQDGNQALKAFDSFQPALCIFDVMLPGIDGFSLSESIRRKDQQTPILFLTARDMVEDRIKGFRSGGDDYITKPFSMEELLLRIKVFLSRSGKSKSSTQREVKSYKFGNLSIDFSKHTLVLNSKSQTLTDKENALFDLFIGSKERILKREEILMNIWGDDDYFMGRSLDVFISKMRKYLKGSSVEIKNYHGIGFKWEESDFEN